MLRPKNFGLVPETGLEPAHQMAYAPKAYVYTNFTTRAYHNYTITANKKRDPPISEPRQSINRLDSLTLRALLIR